MFDTSNPFVNAAGLAEIITFLAANHKSGADMTFEMIGAWAGDAERQMRHGNPPSIEIKARDSVTGAAIEYTVSPAGVE